jgi:hypothetical protein
MLEAAIDFLDTCMCLIQMDVQRHIDRCKCLYNSLNFSELNEDLDVLMMEELRQMYSEEDMESVVERRDVFKWGRCFPYSTEVFFPITLPINTQRRQYICTIINDSIIEQLESKYAGHLSIHCIDQIVYSIKQFNLENAKSVDPSVTEDSLPIYFPDFLQLNSRGLLDLYANHYYYLNLDVYREHLVDEFKRVRRDFHSHAGQVTRHRL